MKRGGPHRRPPGWSDDSGHEPDHGDEFGPGDFTDRGHGHPPHGRGAGRHEGFGPPPGRPRQHRRSRGLLRSAILLLLDEQAMHGYQIISELAERTGGDWRPSAGAVYPTLAQLGDEGLVSVTDSGGRKIATLTEEGVRYVAAHRAELGTPWENCDVSPVQHRDIRRAADALLATVQHAQQVASEAEAMAISTELEQARRAIHRILADGVEG